MVGELTTTRNAAMESSKRSLHSRDGVKKPPTVASRSQIEEITTYCSVRHMEAQRVAGSPPVNELTAHNRQTLLPGGSVERLGFSEQLGNVAAAAESGRIRISSVKYGTGKTEKKKLFEQERTMGAADRDSKTPELRLEEFKIPRVRFARHPCNFATWPQRRANADHWRPAGLGGRASGKPSGET